MTRGDGRAKRRASDHADEPLDEALRQVGAEILDEPVPERLREILRRAQGESSAAASPKRDERPQRNARR